MRKQILPAFIILCLWIFSDCKPFTNHVNKYYGFVETDEVRLAFQVSGQISEINFIEGEKVQEGDTLAKLDQSEYELYRDMKIAELSAAKAALDKAEAGLRNQEISRSYYILRQNQAKLDLARENLSRIEELYDDGNVSGQEYDNALSEYRIIEAQTNASLQEYSLASEGTRDEDIRIAFEKFMSAEKALDLAQLQLTHTYLISPAEGILEELTYSTGEIISAGYPVALICTVDTVKVVFWIEENRLGDVKTGQTIRVFSDSYPNGFFEGFVVSVSEKAEFTPSVVYTEDERSGLVYEVQAIVPNDDQTLKSGMPVTVEIGF